MSVVSELAGFASADAGRLALKWLESASPALLVVDGELHIHWANPLARQWLDGREPLSKIREQLHVGRSQQQLRRLLGRADRGVDGICVPMDSRRAHLVVSARRITKKSEDAFYGLVARCTDSLETRLLAVDDAFRLTTAEGRVLEQLIRGLTAPSIARHLDVSIETVRTHIRSLYTKLEVSSREAMFRRLRPFMVSV